MGLAAAVCRPVAGAVGGASEKSQRKQNILAQSPTELKMTWISCFWCYFGIGSSRYFRSREPAHTRSLTFSIQERMRSVNMGMRL